jgi:hypothetical protein
VIRALLRRFACVRWVWRGRRLATRAKSRRSLGFTVEAGDDDRVDPRTVTLRPLRQRNAAFAPKARLDHQDTDRRSVLRDRPGFRTASSFDDANSTIAAVASDRKTRDRVVVSHKDRLARQAGLRDRHEVVPTPARHDPSDRTWAEFQRYRCSARRSGEFLRTAWNGWCARGSAAATDPPGSDDMKTPAGEGGRSRIQCI